ncbi:MAG: prepilin-type N-terminal cleavage/methylation domain-containing protein [Candidatus Omnitrophica bacterium]|nr:prepilin-type N-terminal cleavage/methylation domain-containing protein [Candidatus Omnitrophota bacterium]
MKSERRATNDERRTAAFTLMEMMLALVLFAVGTLAVMSLIQRAHAGMADGENVLIATHLAQRRLAELRNTAYGSLVSESKASVTSPSGFTRFSRAVTVTEPLSNLKQIVVTVYWNTQGGEASTPLQTHVSQH